MRFEVDLGELIGKYRWDPTHWGMEERHDDPCGIVEAAEGEG
jgi:hypothetical protein